MKKFLLFLLVTVSLCLPAGRQVTVVRAADLDVSCTASACTPGSTSALFPSTIIWYPGLSVSKVVSLQNNSGATHDFKSDVLNTSTTGALSGVTNFVVTRNFDSVTVWSGTLAEFYTAGEVTLESIPDGATRSFTYTASLPTSLGNEYQNKSNAFDLRLGFYVPPASPTSSGGSVAGASTFVCNDEKPGTPTLLSVTPTSLNSVVLTWTSVSPVTYYLVAYGTSPGVMQYGNPNVGGPGTTSTTVSGLSGGTTYYFRVRAGNGCATGEFSNELSVRPTGGYIAGPAEGFVENVLGENTEVTVPSPSPETVPGSTLGIEDNLPVCGNCRIWPYLLVLTILTVGYCLTKRSYLVGLILPILTYLVYLWLSHSCVSPAIPWWCRYLWLILLIEYGFLIWIFSRFVKRTNIH
ncbi:MAG: fibronectin type III domain-containing protein [bacterium]